MKKIVKMTFAALTAALMLSTAVTAPVCAAEKKSPVGYVLGDINMDGRIALDDCLIALQYVTNAMMMDVPNELTAEQIALGNVWNSVGASIPMALSLEDALCILQHYSAEYLISKGEPVNWETVLGKEAVEKQVLTADRGDYTIEFSEEKGDYVIVQKG